METINTLTFADPGTAATFKCCSLAPEGRRRPVSSSADRLGRHQRGQSHRPYAKLKRAAHVASSAKTPDAFGAQAEHQHDGKPERHGAKGGLEGRQKCRAGGDLRRAGNGLEVGEGRR